MKTINKGFTLMELLIVIGVLGILAAGLLAAIDPFEQLKKARDTNNRSATIELLSSLTRYYANHGAFPWNMTTPPTGCDTGTIGIGALGTSSISVQDAAFQTCLTNSLVSDGELKTTYFDGIGSTKIYVASDTTDLTNVVVCFSPEGKSLRSDPATKYLISDGTSGGGSTIVEQSPGSGASCPDVSVSTCAQCFK